MSKTLSRLKIRKLSIPKTFPRSKSSVTFNFNPTLVAKTDAKSNDKPKFKRRTKSDAKSKTKRYSQYCPKQHKYDGTQVEHIDYTLGLLNSLPLPAHYKTKLLLDNLANLSDADLPNYIPDCVRCPKPVSLNTVGIQTISMPSADVFPWHPDNDDPSY